jgi:hypothetical protein
MKSWKPAAGKAFAVFGFVASTLVVATIIVAIAFEYIESPKEILLRKQNDDLRMTILFCNSARCVAEANAGTGKS